MGKGVWELEGSGEVREGVRRGNATGRGWSGRGSVRCYAGCSAIRVEGERSGKWFEVKLAGDFGGDEFTISEATANGRTNRTKGRRRGELAGRGKRRFHGRRWVLGGKRRPAEDSLGDGLLYGILASIEDAVCTNPINEVEKTNVVVIGHRVNHRHGVLVESLLLTPDGECLVHELDEGELGIDTINGVDTRKVSNAVTNCIVDHVNSGDVDGTLARERGRGKRNTTGGHCCFIRACKRK